MPSLVRRREREFLSKAQPEPPADRVGDFHTRQIYPVRLVQRVDQFALQAEESRDGLGRRRIRRRPIRGRHTELDPWGSIHQTNEDVSKHAVPKGTSGEQPACASVEHCTVDVPNRVITGDH